MTYQQISRTSSAESKTPTTSELRSKPLAPIAKQTTSTRSFYERQEQPQGLLNRETNLLKNLDLVAEPNAKRLQPMQAKLPTIRRVKSDTALSELNKAPESISPQAKLTTIRRVKSDTALSELNKAPESISPQVLQPEQSQPPELEQDLLDRETQSEVITQESHSQQQSQQQQSLTTGFQKIKESIAKSFDATKEVRKVLAEGIKQHETYSDQTKILGQDSPKSNIDQVLGQNLPANEKNPMTILKPLPADMPQKFGNDAAVIGMSRDMAKATGGLLRVPDNLKKFKDAVFVNKDEPIHERIGDASGGLGEIVSTVTYTGIVLSQAVRGIEHHTKKQPGQKTTFASGAITAVKLGGKLGGKTIPSIGQGGLIGGTSLPFDIGKATASTLTSIPKLIATVDKAYKAYPLENFGGYEYLVSGLRNVTDLTKSVAGAIKDVAGLVNNLNVVGAGAEGTQIVAGGAVAPAAGAVLGGIEVIEGADKFRKAYNQYRNPGEIPENKTLNQFKKEQKDKMIRAGIDTTLGAVALGAGVVGFNGGPRELLAATAMGASVGGFQIGEWGIRKLKQKVQHNSQATTFDVEQGYQPEATANILHQP